MTSSNVDSNDLQKILPHLVIIGINIDFTKRGFEPPIQIAGDLMGIIFS